MTSLPLPGQRSVRARIAIGLALTTLLVAALVAVAATAFSAWQGEAGDGGTQVGAALVDDVTVVIVSEEGAAAAAEARAATLRWSLIALGLSVIPAVAVGWFVAGRMLRTVDSALADVESAEAERQRRLQDVVHELRTPLAVMSTNLELAVSGPDFDNDAAAFVEAARRALDRMDRTVDDLAGHGGLAVDTTHEPVDIAAVAAAVVEEFSGPASRRGLHLVAATQGPLEAESAEAPALRTVVGNLVSNAVRLAPRGSVVRVDWGSLPQWVWVAVTDEGPGLPDRDHARVFERGWRGAYARHRADDGGRGLGLTIARQLSEAQGGVLTVSSEEGTGSTFTVWLPSTLEADATDVLATDGVHPALEPWRPTSVSP